MLIQAWIFRLTPVTTWATTAFYSKNAKVPHRLPRASYIATRF